MKATNDMQHLVDRATARRIRDERRKREEDCPIIQPDPELDIGV